MTPLTLREILKQIADEPSLIWQAAFLGDEVPSEEARLLALAVIADSDWLPSVISCIQVPNEEDISAGRSITKLNWNLRNFLSAWVAKHTEVLLPALRTLLMDEQRRLFALSVLARVETYTVAGEEVQLHELLQEYKTTSLQWSEVEYQSYLQAFLSIGITKALAIFEETLQRLPEKYLDRRKYLLMFIEHFRNLQNQPESRPPRREQQEQITEGLDYLKHQGVLQLILEIA